MSQAPANNHLDEDSFFSEMISSQSGLDDQLTRLKEVVECSRPMDDKIEELSNFLSDSNLQNATVDILDEKIFSVALDCASKVYFEVIETLNKTLESKNDKVIDDVKKQLKFLGDIVYFWDLCLEHVKSLDKVSITDVKSIPETLFKVFYSALSHCKTSAESYENIFSSVSDLLASFFRQCVNIINLFYSSIDSPISFDTSREEEMNILLTIIDETGKLATLVCNMESKTLTDMWKRFGKLSTVYAMEIKNQSAERVTRHFCELAKNIISILSTVNTSNQYKVNERAILCYRVLMKILEKLCDTYSGWIRNDVMLEIVKMLSELYRYKNLCFKLERFSAEVIKLVESNFSIVIEPFFDVVFKSESFKLAFLEHGKSEVENVLGYHYLILAIIKKLSMLPYEVQREWCSKEKSILDICFKMIDKLTHEICIARVQISVSQDAAQMSYMANIYEATCLNIFSLVCQVATEDFSELEVLLLRHLLSGKFYASLLSSDTWCFICRLGSSDMCYSHFRYLLQVYDSLKDRNYNLNVIMLSNLLSRLYIFLAERNKLDFVNNIKRPSDVYTWSSIVRTMDVDKKKILQKRINAYTINDRIPQALNTLEEHPLLENFNSLVNDLSIIAICDVPYTQKTADTLLSMWNTVVNIMADCEGPPLLLLEDLVTSLLRASHSEQVQAKYMTSVLESMVSLYPYASSSLRLEFCYFFKSRGPHLTLADSSLVAELFSRLLIDDNPCVQQQGFESFELLTQSCPDTGLIASVATSIRNSQNEVLSKTLPAYISNEVVHKLVGFDSTADFYEELCEAATRRKTRWADKKYQVCREEKVPRMENHDRWNDDIESKAEMVCKDLENIEKMKGQLKRDTWERLRKMCQNILAENS